MKRSAYPVLGELSAALRGGDAATRLAQESLFGRAATAEAIDRGAVRQSNASAADLTVPDAMGRMASTPLVVEVDATGLAQFRLEFTGSSVQSGAQSVRLDWEQSSDGGGSWRPDGYAVWLAGKLAKDRLGNPIAHYHEMKAIEYKTDPGGNARSVATVWPQGTKFRFHWRQLNAGRLGVVVKI